MKNSTRTTEHDGIDPDTGWAYGWLPCGLSVCWKEAGHDGACAPSGRPHPDEETD